MCRNSYFHIVNNDYTHWEVYTIAGSSNPTINSQGNRYLAPVNHFAKEVTRRVVIGSKIWRHWNWRSEGDLMLNGAYYTPIGRGAVANYARDMLLRSLVRLAKVLSRGTLLLRSSVRGKGKLLLRSSVT
ncbi:unnamed protein product [Fraxinus pennsylvanica]|uniref:Pectate lyase n=1 Tax=Fraxinus pennsylvanica TaxID=56036 RepID=A0AAD2A8X8_9LAMI|nr:unnamed protein product [Fraxinus pennsylvanica]